MRLLFVAFLFCSSVARAAETATLFETVTPESVGFDSEKLAEIDKLMSSEVESGRIAGALGLVARGDKIVYFDMWGHLDREKEIPMRSDAIFRIYSMSKPITSIATMQLVEREKMQLDDPVSKYLPIFKDMKVLQNGEEVDADREVTVRDLLRHTSGLTYGIFGDSPVDMAYRKKGLLFSNPTIEDMVKKLDGIPLQHQPGTRWHYSISTDVLGRLVEVVSGQRFDEYLDEHIFEPLDMHDTFFMVPEEKRDRFAQMYAPDGKGLKPANRFSSMRFLNRNNKFFSGGGGLCSTTRDYLRFATALLNGGELDGKRIISKDTLGRMTRNQLTGRAKRGGFQFGLGFAISPEGEFSWGGAAGTRFWVNPNRNLITIYMIQINPYRGGFGTKMKDIVFAADKIGPKAEDAPTAPMP